MGTSRQGMLVLGRKLVEWAENNSHAAEIAAVRKLQTEYQSYKALGQLRNLSRADLEIRKREYERRVALIDSALSS